MNRFLQILVASSAIAVAANSANATEITWNFGTSGYSLVNPTGGPDAANASGTTGAITPTNGQGAVFKDTSGLYSVTAFADSTDNSPQPHISTGTEKVTQSNNYSVTANGVTSTLTGLGACNSSCTGVLTAIGDTEMLGINLGSHPAWTLGSITFENFLLSPSTGQVILWLSNSSNGATPEDITTLPSPTACNATGADGSCTFDFSAADVNSYSYLFVTGVNYNGVQPSIEVTQLTGNTVAVPEPATLSLLGAGLFAFGVARRRRRKV
jgi:hypothetical protein